MLPLDVVKLPVEIIFAICKSPVVINKFEEVSFGDILPVPIINLPSLSSHPINAFGFGDVLTINIPLSYVFAIVLESVFNPVIGAEICGALVCVPDDKFPIIVKFPSIVVFSCIVTFPSIVVFSCIVTFPSIVVFSCIVTFFLNDVLLINSLVLFTTNILLKSSPIIQSPVIFILLVKLLPVIKLLFEYIVLFIINKSSISSPIIVSPFIVNPLFAFILLLKINSLQLLL